MDFILKYWVEFAFSIVISLLTLLFKKIKKYYQNINNLKTSVLELLRNQIIALFNIYSKRECIDLYEKNALENLYIEYKKLGGDGFIDDLMEKIDELKIEKNCK